MKNKPSVLVAADWYIPGFKGGGPITTLANMVNTLGEEFFFKIITRDRDLGDEFPYSGIKADTWQNVGNAEVLYLSPRSLSFSSLRKLMNKTSYDILYLNSFFSSKFTIKPLLIHWLGLSKRSKIILAPRGEFLDGAIKIKGFKKRLYLDLSKRMGLYKDVLWQASSLYEEMDIIRCVGDGAKIVIAQDLTGTQYGLLDQTDRLKKIEGNLSIVFLSRVSRNKNLDGALRMLSGLSGNIIFDIYGPIKDTLYWSECMAIIRSLPENIKVEYKGPVPHDLVSKTIMKYDLFFLPTLGENFGHVILEALTAGCPVLISDQTPWRGLREKGVGWDIPLLNDEQFKAVLQECVDMTEIHHNELSQNAYEYALKCITNKDAVNQNRYLFQKALDS